MTREKLKGIVDQLSEIIGKYATEGCFSVSDVHRSCAERFMDRRDKEGKPIFWYGVDCRLPIKEFCPPCLTEWWFQVARNLVIGDMQAAP